MKKIGLFIFISLVILLIPINISALNDFVYWIETIGGDSDSNSLYSYLNKYVSKTTLDSITKIEFNDIERTNNVISGTNLDISKNQDYSVTAILNDNVLYIQYSGTLRFNENSSRVFQGFKSVQEITGLEYVDTSNVKNMSHLFSDSFALRTVNLTQINTSNVTDMSYMFSSTKVDVSDIDKMDTSKVEDMSYMFESYYNEGELDLSNLDTSNVKNMSYMLSHIYSSSLNITGWDTSKVENMSYMFYNTDALNILNLSILDTSNVTDMSYMFANMDLATLDLSSFDTGNVTTMKGMFNQSNFESLNLSGWNTSNVVDMSYMFLRGYYLSELNMEGWDTSKVENMSHMFDDSKASLYDLSHFDTSNVKDMSGMFSSTTVPDISHFNTSNVENMSEMFEYATIYSDISNFDTSKVKNMYQMFYSVYETALNLTGWDTSNVENMSEMFAQSNKLTTIYVGDKWSVENVTKYKNMFYQSGGITGHVGTKYSAEHDALEYSRIDTPSEPGYFSLFINMKSNDYKIYYSNYPYYHRYIYTSFEKFDINKITVDAGIIKKEGDKVNIYYKNEIIESYDIVTISSDVYQVGDGYIFTDNDLYYDESLVNITNGVMEKYEWGPDIRIYYKNDQVESYIETIYVLNFYTSYQYDKEKGYIYTTDGSFDKSQVNFSSGETEIKDNKLILSYEDNIVAEYRIFNYYSSEYDLSKDYIYTGPYEFDKSKIDIQYAILKEIDNKLQIVVDEDVIREFDLISISSDEYEYSGNYVYTENGVVDKNKIKAINCTIDVDSEYIRVYYGDNLMESYRIVSNKVDLSVSMNKVINWLETTNVSVIKNQYNPNYNPYITKLESSTEEVLKILDNSTVLAIGIGEAIITITDSFGDIYKINAKSVSQYGNDYKVKGNIIVMNNFDETYDMFNERIINKISFSGLDISPSEFCQDSLCTGTKFNFYGSYITSFEIARRGDLSGDGEIDSLDLATMMNHISGKKELMGAHLEAAYLNNDEDIDSLDLAYLMNHIAGKEGY